MANAKLAAPYIERGEGGLSRATTDTASANPAPWLYKGVGGWHTNRGITYSTFANLAPKLGYKNDAATFFGMPDDVWNKIFKNGYWDPVNADKINSDPLAIYATSWLWGSGVAGGGTRLKNFLAENGVPVSSTAGIYEGINRLESKLGTQRALDAMLEARKQQFVAMNQPANLKGWLNRLEMYRKSLTELVKKKEP